MKKQNVLKTLAILSGMPFIGCSVIGTPRPDYVDQRVIETLHPALPPEFVNPPSSNNQHNSLSKQAAASDSEGRSKYPLLESLRTSLPFLGIPDIRIFDHESSLRK